MTDLYKGIDEAVRLTLLAAFVAYPLRPELTPHELKTLVLEQGFSEPFYDEAVERRSQRHEVDGRGIGLEVIDLVALRMRGLFPRQLRYNPADEVCRAFRSLNEKMGAKAPKTVEMLCSQGRVAVADVEAGLGLLLIYQLASKANGGFTCTTHDMRGYCDEVRTDASELEARLETMAARVRAVVSVRNPQTGTAEHRTDLRQADASTLPDPARAMVLGTAHQGALDLIAHMLVDERLSQPMAGLDIRKRMPKAPREEKTRILRRLVPDFLTLYGRESADSYTLAPRGALSSTQATRFLEMASAVRPFLVAEYSANRQKVTWDSIKASVLVGGRAPLDSERELVGYVLVCLGVWGGAADWWPRPPAPQLEDFLDEDLDERTLFTRGHDALVRQREAMQDLDAWNRPSFLGIMPDHQEARQRLAGDAEQESELGTSPGEFGSDIGRENVPDPSKVFIIHGRNLAARSAVEQFVRCLGLHPLDFDKVSSDLGGSPFIGDVVRKGLELAHAAIALFTPDEYASLHPSHRWDADKFEEAHRWQSRPNVIFEAGMALGLNPLRTILVTFGDNVSLFSDVAGVHTLRLDNGIESRKRFRRRLIGIKCAVNQDEDAWTDSTRSGDFERCVAAEQQVSPADAFAARPTS